MPRDASGKLQLSDIDYLETWKGIEECKRQGLARSIGISNFNSEQITRLLAAATIKPVNNQVTFTMNLIIKLALVDIAVGLYNRGFLCKIILHQYRKQIQNHNNWTS